MVNNSIDINILNIQDHDIMTLAILGTGKITVYWFSIYLVKEM